MSACANCGAENPAGQRFCGDCGTPLALTLLRLRQPPTRPGSGSAASAARRSSRRVGRGGARSRARRPRPSGAWSPCSSPISSASPTLSEARDAEDVRELLSRYFELARTLIARYGGTVEKFIGDAVMAVWGTPTATEDDAERAVRAALDLVAAVPDLDPGAAGARAGVLTGEAAVTIGAEGQGMVAGDLVNTASRIQSAAEPGHGARRRVDAAGHRAGDRLRGGRRCTSSRARPSRCRCSARCGSSPASGGRAQVGRARGAVRRPRPRAEADQGPLPRLGRRRPRPPRVGHRHRRHRQVAPGLGVLQVLRRHRRHRLVAPRPLPRLRRGRRLLGARRHGAHALPASARTSGRTRPAQKLAATLHEHLLDPEERAFVEPRLAHLLGLEERCAATARSSSPPGGSSSSGWPTRIRPCSRSRTCSGRTRACSTSSSTCSSGRATTRSSWSRSPARSCTSAAPAGAPAQRNFTLALPRAALASRRWRRCSTGSCPGLPERAARPDPRPRRGRPALRGRDGADAARPRPARRGRPRLPADGRDRGARRARDAARPDRRPPRRPRAGGAPPAPGRSRARQDVHRARAGRARRASPRRSSSRCSPRSCARRCSASSPTRARPSAASTASCRTSSATSPTRRSPSASARAGTSPPPSYLERAFADEDEVAEVLASHYLAAVEAAPDAEDADEIRAEAREHARPGRRARGVARRARRGPALLRAGGRAHPGRLSPGPS